MSSALDFKNILICKINCNNIIGCGSEIAGHRNASETVVDYVWEHRHPGYAIRPQNHRTYA